MFKTFICMNDECIHLRIHNKRWEHKTLSSQEVKMCQKCRKKMIVKEGPQ